MGVADVVHEEQRPFKGVLGVDDAKAERELDVIEEKARAALVRQVLRTERW